MTWISKSVTAFGLILLAHACYSAHEHSALLQTTSTRASVLSSLTASPAVTDSIPSKNPGAATASSALPIDIAVETVIATLVICLGLVANTATLKPIQWRVWAGQLEREEGEMSTLGAAGASRGDESKVASYTGNPFRLLESRPGFVDIRKQRREFAEWAKGQS